MPQQESKTDMYVDPYTMELFYNYTITNYNRLVNNTDYSAKERLEALVVDAQDFIDLITNEFEGLSIDYSAEAYAHNFVTDLNQ